MTPGARKIAVAAAGLALIALAAVVALATANSIPNYAAAAQATTDYDDDDDGLIDVRTIAQLNAMRHDRDGNGNATHADYATAYPNRDTNAATRMGCPSGTCAGYELRAHLDFDTDDDGDVDANDDIPNWTPIGGLAFTQGTWTTEFKGNNFTISNLTINTSSGYVGLFGSVRQATISGVGLIDANMTSTRSGPTNYFGALVGSLVQSTVRSSYSTGSLSATGSGHSSYIGGLVGFMSNVGNGSTIAASWSSVNVSGVGSGSGGTVSTIGGLAGNKSDGTITASYATGSVTATGSGTAAGGLVGGTAGGTITASYAIGPATSTGSGGVAGGLHGFNSALSPTTVTASYWDATTSGIADDADADMPEGKTTRELQSPSPYTDIYTNWNVNVDGNAGNDDPWDFGQAMQYPMLKYGGMSVVRQGSLAMGAPDVDTNGESPTVGRMARVCLTTGPSLRAAGTGGAAHQPWIWQRSTSWSRNLGDAGWTNIAEDGGGTYEYTPVAADRGRYLRACVALNSSDSRAGGTDKACVGPFAPVQ